MYYRGMENHPAKNFALQLGSLLSLYITVGFFLALLFGLIDICFPDDADTYWHAESAANSIRLGFAMVVVFFPTYLVLTRIVSTSRRHQKQNSYLGLTKWLIYLSLLVGGGVLLGDLVAVIYAFLEGDITTRFILKAVAVLIVTGLAFYYYLQDARGYWLKREKQSLAYGCLVATVVFTTLVISLAYIKTPTEVREQKIDEQQVQDLRDIQWAVDSYLRSNERLPEEITAAFDLRPVPVATDDRATYTYEVTETGFSLCAEFAHDAQTDDRYYPYYDKSQTGPHIVNPDDWYYEAGEWCFTRTVVLE